jgi:hypothetical protein
VFSFAGIRQALLCCLRRIKLVVQKVNVQTVSEFARYEATLSADKPRFTGGESGVICNIIIFGPPPFAFLESGFC